MKRNLLILGGVTLSILVMTVSVKAQPRPGETGAGLPTPGGDSGGLGSSDGPGGEQPNPVGGEHGDNGFNNPQRQEFRQKMLDKFDTNHDGQLDDSERAQMREFMQQRKMREQNGGQQGGTSGTSGGQNKQLGQGFGQQEQGGPGNSQWQEHRQKMLDKFDANHDGQLDDGERAKMREFMQQRRMMREQQTGNTGGTPPTSGQQ